MPSVHETLISVCHIPRDFPTSSLKGLVERSGYLTHPQEITQDVIEKHVRANPELIQEWLQYSWNKRGGHCYLDQTEVGAPFLVGILQTGERKQFDDGAEACAAFIKIELERFCRTPSS